MPRLAEALAVRCGGRDGTRIALAADRVDWHVKELAEAFARSGAQAIPVRLSACGFDTRRASGLTIKGFGTGLPEAMFVRAIGAGSFEEITLRLGLLHALGESGIVVHNSARAVEHCVDKAATSFLLARHDISTPPTWTVQSRAQAESIVRREAARGPLVLKPLFGAQGRGLKLVRRAEDLPPREEIAGVYYLQRFVGFDRGGFSDIRLLVSRGRVVAAMRRHASQWITNVKLGGRPEAHIPRDDEADLAIRAAAAVGADFAGVDLIRGRDDIAYVLEVNSMPGWRGLQSVTQTRIADVLARDLLAALGSRHSAAIPA
ncbi:MAG: tetrahydromethanopterin:alpha-L-glutamate ligase [Methylobacteriaceae bacterium]|nr:tetrahydromethanopterin:alpha-L-glutamate ligase [Methylobacteriaceae bacterium]